MPQTLDDIIKLSETLRRTKQWVKALKIYRLIMEAAPHDSEFRLDIADAVMALGHEDKATAAYTETCKFCSRAGYPLLSIVAAKKLALLKKEEGEEMMRAIAGLFGVESETIGKTARLAPVDRSTPVKEGIDLDYPIEPDELVQNTLQLMVAAAATAPFPNTLPPIPILSDLPAELFVRLLQEVKLVTVDADKVLIREGEEASTFYIIAKGKVAISKAGGPGKKIELARLGEGSVFGEMALITQSPRTATVETVEDAELLEFEKDKLASLSQDSVVIEAALERFTRERLVSNLLATNPIFQPFDRKQRYELLSRFTAHEVTPGTVLVRDGQVGRGLYIILYGQADVIKKEDGQDVLITTLRSGDIFGEISLIKDTPTTATVAAASHCTILFLPKEYFQRLTQSIGDLKDYFDKLSAQRLSMTEKAMLKAHQMDEEAIVLEDELIMI